MDESSHGPASAAIEAVARAGHSRNSRPAQRIIIGGCTLALTLAAILWFWWLRPELVDLNTNSPVAVLLPIRADMANTPTAEIDTYLSELSSDASITEGAVVANAKRLWEGFSDAFSASQVDPGEQHHYYFAYPFEADTRNKIMAQLEMWYEDVGIRTFIITMSGAAIPLLGELGTEGVFRTWAQNKPENDRPILVATVASAPDIADRENGVFRHYIRSREESSVLATYIKSLNTTEIGIFFVNDEYGNRAYQVLDSLLPIPKKLPFLINLDPEGEKNNIQTAVPIFIENLSIAENAVAVIIGYGTMMKTMVETLEENQFNGKILIASTFTEEKWRPSLDGLADRIRTVGPGERGLDSDKRGVVYQFSYLTLVRALHCRNERGVEALWGCWSGPYPQANGADWADVEFTTNGDSIVTSLRLLEVAEN